MQCSCQQAAAGRFTSLWAFAGLLILGSGDVLAQVDRAAVPAAPFPQDRIGILFKTNSCPATFLDPSRRASIQQLSATPDLGGNREHDIYSYQLTYWVMPDPNPICGTAPPPTYDSVIDIGVLPRGIHQIQITGLSNISNAFDSHQLTVRVRDWPRPGRDLSGVWYAPEQSGRGVFVARRGAFTGFWWSNHDADGDPAWVIMTAGNVDGIRFEGEAINTFGPPMAPGPADIETQRWGDLAFTYLGCGRAHMEWSADDEAIGDGSIDLVQLLVPDGIPDCDITQRVQGPPAIWEAPAAE